MTNTGLIVELQTSLAFIGDSPTVLPRLSSNSWSPCLSHSSVIITGLHNHTQLSRWLFNTLTSFLLMYTKKQDNMAVPFSASPSKPMPLFLEQGHPAVLWCVPKRMLNTFHRPTSVIVWCLLLYSFCTEHLWLLRILLCVHICIVELSSLILYKERRGAHWHLHRDCSDSLPPSWTIYWTILTLRLCYFLKSPSSLFLLHYWNTCTSL